MYRIQNAANQTEILLYSLIYDGITADQVISQLPAEGEIVIRINSDGGDVFEAVALYNYLKGRNVHVIVDGLCASAASIVLCCGARVTMKTGTMLMLHRPLTTAWGNADELREAAGILDKVSDRVAEIYQAKSGLNFETVNELMGKETWLSAEEALSYGFCDDVETVPAPAPEEPAKTYEDGIRDERRRLYELDELACPGREVLLKSAKYMKCQTAQEVAVDILKAERSRPSIVSAYVPGDYDGAIEMMVKEINQKRGVKA